MAGLFNTLNTSVKGMNAQQTALHTTGHNISNVNTEGFSRQRVEMKADAAYNYAGVGQVGTGVKLTGVVRMVDEFVDLQIRKENSTLHQYLAKKDIMTQIEMIFNEPSATGLNFSLGEMFNAWQELSKNPESLNAKSIVAEKGRTFAEGLNHMAQQIEDLRRDVVGGVEKQVFDIHSLSRQLQDVNAQIFNVAVKGHSPNDLLDQRDLLLKRLSSLTEFEYSLDKWGRADVRIAGQTMTSKEQEGIFSVISDLRFSEDGTQAEVLVSIRGDSTNQRWLSMSADEASALRAGSTAFFHLESGTLNLATLQEGKLGGSMEALRELDVRLSDLDRFAEGTATMINVVHEDGGEGTPFFVFEGQGGARGIRVNPEILANEALVVSGRTADSPVGDGSRALAIASLRNTRVNFSNLDTFHYDPETMRIQDVPGGVTMEGSYRDVVIKVGISTEHAMNMVENQEALMGQLYNRRESVSGVSIDEEVTNLIKYQRSFEANSRVISAISEMLDTLINRTGA